jgi:transposase, IS5 family
MDRRWLQGAAGDALHAVLRAAGFNVRWLLRAIAAKGLKAVLLVFSQWIPWLRWITSALPIALLVSHPLHALALLRSAQT